MSSSNTVVVIGAGIAGATTAVALQKAGYEVIVLDKASGPAMGASTNPICSMYPRFDAQWNKYTIFYLEAYQYALKFYQNYPAHFIQSGLLALPRPDQRQKFAIIAEMLGSDICQLHDSKAWGEGLLLPHSGYVHIKLLCGSMLQDAKVLYGQEVQSLKRKKEEWEVLNQEGKVVAAAKYIVLANGCDASSLISELAGVIYTVRGQSSATTADIGYDGGYVLCFPCISITPVVQGSYHFGSTYDRNYSLLEISEASHQQNLSSLGGYFPKAKGIHPNELRGAVGNRCFTKDYLPIVGEIPGYNGVYLNVAHGSRGVVSAPISANLLTEMIGCNADSKINAILTPKRFINNI